MNRPVVVSAVICATPQTLYDLITDVARMGEYSPEATGALRARPNPQVGDTFIGVNRRGPMVWYTQCVVTAADRGTRFAFDVNVGPVPLSHWSYGMSPLGDGRSLVTETWIDRRRGPVGLLAKAAGQLLIPGSRPEHNRATMTETLHRLQRAAEMPAAA